MHSYEHYSRQELLEKIEELETTIKQLSSGSPLQKEEDFSLPLHVAQEKIYIFIKKKTATSSWMLFLICYPYWIGREII